MKDMNALLAGFGGQGILFMGKVIAYAGPVSYTHLRAHETRVNLG